MEPALRDDRRQLLRDIADNTGINRETACLIVIEDLDIMEVSTKVVQKI